MSPILVEVFVQPKCKKPSANFNHQIQWLISVGIRNEAQYEFYC